MGELRTEAASFKAEKDARSCEARQRAALQIVCGIDLDAALRFSGEQLDAAVQRIERALRCERLKGLRRHWSYDLNRHIALKQALDRLRQTGPVCEKQKRRIARRPAELGLLPA